MIALKQPLSRRNVLGGLAAVAAMPAAAAPLSYTVTPQPIGEGLWMVRGADAPVEMANGGAIANIAIMATDAGTVLVDCGPSLRYGEALKKAAEQVAGRPVTRIYLTHLHPDHGFGAGAFPDAMIAALPGTRDEIARDGGGFSDGMYRLLGDWMRGTQPIVPGEIVSPGAVVVGGRSLRLIGLSGHSEADLAILDERSGVLIAGDLVFHNRAPSTPDADLAAWRTSLDRLKSLGHRMVLPGHGPFDPSPAVAIDQTRDWLDWLEQTLTRAVANGRDMVEAGDLPIPDRFAAMQAARYELQRSVSHLYPGLEARLLPRVDTR